MSHWTEEERNEALRRRMEGAPLMQGAPSLNSLKFVSKGEAAVVGGEVQDDFLPAESFDGSKNGYIFKKGSHGLGYYLDRGPNKNIEEGEMSSSYDIEKHARGLKEVERVQRPGEGRVGALGDLLAENKAKKQEEFDKIIHDNRFCPPKALDDDEVNFLGEKEREIRERERQREEEERRTQREFRLEQAEQKTEKDSIDLAKIMGQKRKHAETNAQSSYQMNGITWLQTTECKNRILSKLISANRKTGAELSGEKKQRQAEPAGGNALSGLADYDDSD